MQRLSRHLLLLVALVLMGGIAWHLLLKHNSGTSKLATAPLAVNTSAGSEQVDSATSTAPAPTVAPLETDDLLEAWVGGLPTGRLRESIELLSLVDRRIVKANLERLSVPRNDYASLVAVSGGGLHYVCSFGHTHDAHAGVEAMHEAPAASLSTSDGSSPTASAADIPNVPIANPPIRHSRPGAPNVLYLDFNGHTITGTHWNTTRGVATYVALPYDTDGDASTFSGLEQAVIIDVWRRVAEDFSPFDVNVTTEEPAVFNDRTGRALITRHTDANGVAMPHLGFGGVAFLDVFGRPGYVSSYSPAFIYSFDHADSIAQVVSHEIGHNLGLSHDGNIDLEYYDGHGLDSNSWNPIMGTGGRNVTQWSKGEYYLANNPQDDLAIISAITGYRVDEAGSTPATAASPALDGETFSVTGVLNNSADIDVYAVSTSTGTIEFAATAFQSGNGTRGNNADLRLELINSAGDLVASAENAIGPDATLSYAASSGTYYVRIVPVGAGEPTLSPPTGYTAYGSAGQYTLSGTLVVAPPAIKNGGAISVGVGSPFNFSVSATNSPSVFGAAGLPAGLTFDAATGVIGGRPLVVGVFAVALSAVNELGTGTATLMLTVTDAPPAIVEQTAGLQVVAPGGALTFSVTALSPSGSASYQWKHNGISIAGATGSALSLNSINHTSSGYYQLIITNPIGVTASASIFVLVAPHTPRVTAWGDDAEDSLNPSPTLAPVMISAGPGHTLALKADGTVVGWGANYAGETDIPSGLAKIVAVAAGQSHSVALREDGTLVTWGATVFGPPPIGLANVVAIAAGQYFDLALKSDGTVVGWGSNYYGESSVPPGLHNVVAIAAGTYHALALTSDGTVVGWGNNDSGQASTPSGLNNVVAIAAGDYHSIALKSDGTVAHWGYFGSETPPVALSGIISIAGGYNHAIALKSDGTVVAWGGDIYGQSKVPSGLGQGFAISAGGNRSYLLRDGDGDLVPSISAHPLGQAVVEGADVTLSVTVTAGTSPLKFQWRRDGTILPGQTSPTLVLSGILPAQAGAYDVVVSSTLGTATSNPTDVVVTALPAITAYSPPRLVLNPGQPLQLSVTATGTGPLAYQWYHNGRSLSGATASVYSPGAATSALGGAYWVTITDSVGTRRSAFSFVAVAPAVSAVTAWGADDAGQTSIPSGLNDVIALAAGYSHALALKSDGTVVGWGNNVYGQANVPSGLNNVVAIAAGNYHSLALKSDGTVTFWGYSGYGAPPAGLSDVVALAAGAYHSLALKADGSVVGWGENHSGQASVPAGLANVVAVAAGQANSLALKVDGTVVGWGNDGYGQSAAPAGHGGIVAIAASSIYSLALKSDGTVASWGYSGFGAPPVGLSEVMSIAVGDSHSLALRSDGSVVAWGANGSGQASVSGSLAQGFAVAAGGNASYLLRDVGGDLVPNITSHPSGQTVVEGTAVSLSVTATAGTSPLSYQWRRNGTPLSGQTSSALVLSGILPAQAGSYDAVVSSTLGTAISNPAAIVVNALPAITDFSPSRLVLTPGQPLHLSVTATGTGSLAYQWYRNGRAIPGATAASYAPGAASLAVIGAYWVTITDSIGTRRSATSFVNVAPTAGTVVGWGKNNRGQSSIPTGLDNVIALAAGPSNGLALRGDGTVAYWGYSGYGAPPWGLANVVAIDVGRLHSLALKADGTVAHWGYSNQAAPPPGIADVIAVAAGGFHSLALKEDGTVVASGDNYFGQTDVPVGLDNVTAVAAGQSHSLALKADGTVVGWGSNDAGQVNIPNGLNNVVAIAAGYFHSLALKADGTVVGWGLSSSALPSAGLANVLSIAAGAYHSLALNLDGSITVWGSSSDGQSTPPEGLKNVFAISAGDDFSLAAAASGTFFAAFQMRYFTAGQLSDYSVSGAEADPDNDGLPNLHEYAFGLDPLVSEIGGGNRLIPSIDGDRLTLSFIRRIDVSDLVYLPEVSGDLGGWDYGDAVLETLSIVALDPFSELVTVRDRTPLSGQKRRFIRLRVTVSE